MNHLIHVTYLLLLSTVYFLHTVGLSTAAGDQCDIHSLFQCGKNQTCDQIEEGKTTGVCKCPLGYKRRDDGECYIPSVPTPEPNKADPSSQQPVNTASSGLGLAVWLLVPCLIVAVIGVLILAAQRYMWMDRLYQMRVRHYNNVLVGSQGDDDDPPIA